LFTDEIKHGALLHDNDTLCGLWLKRLGHLYYGGLPLLRDMVQKLLDFKIKNTRVYKDDALGKHANTAFPSSEHRSRGILDLILELLAKLPFDTILTFLQNTRSDTKIDVKAMLGIQVKFCKATPRLLKGFIFMSITMQIGVSFL
jgi:hypothetical protein